MKIDTICALATPTGVSAIAVVRLSGPHSFAIAQSIFQGPTLANCSPNTIHYGHIIDGNDVLDEVLISVLYRDLFVYLTHLHLFEYLNL